MNKLLPWDHVEEHLKRQNERVTNARMMAKACEQPHFTLLAQDITADLVVELWVIINAKLQELVEKGWDPYLAVKHLREVHHLPPAVLAGLMKSPKHASAVEIAAQMRGYPSRKVAD